MATTVESLWALIEPWLRAEQLELDDLELLGSGRGRTLRVVVDKTGGIDLDRLAEVSDGISRLLDAESDLEGPYQLEVSSPGLERRLRRPRHWEKSIGREVVVKVRSGEAVETVKGVLVAADANGFTVEGPDTETHGFSYRQVISARTVFRWERSPKPGKKK